MKNTKRILSVTIRRMIDDSPDTSWLGEYSDNPETEFAIDRATSEFTGDIKQGDSILESIKNHLDEFYDEAREKFFSNSAESQGAWLDAINAASDTIHGLRQEFDVSVSWDRREYRYFNGCVENYKDETPENIRKYILQDYNRMESLNRGQWCFIGVRAEAEIGLPCGQGSTLALQTITSGGLWGIESDSEDSYIADEEKNQLAELRDQLKALGFSSRAISKAFQDVQHKDA